MQSLEALIMAEQCQVRLMAMAEQEIDRKAIEEALESTRKTLKALSDWSGKNPGISRLRWHPS